MTTSGALYAAAILLLALYSLYKNLQHRAASQEEKAQAVTARRTGESRNERDLAHPAESTSVQPVRRRNLASIPDEGRHLRLVPHRAETPPAPRKPEPPKPVEEDTTVVMRKQVPPRDEPPRSWVGGLPMMPEGVDWPREVNPERTEHGALPLHFICQIAMADLPPNLWGGLGPREGWLLLFADTNCSEGVYRFVYTHELGAERQVPDDMQVVHDGVYCDGTDWKKREMVYPRFAVDLVPMPAEIYEHEGGPCASPENLQQLLYPNQDVGENGLFRKLTEPFTWRCVALALDKVFEGLDSERYKADCESSHARKVEKLRQPGGMDLIDRDLAEQIEDMLGRYNLRELMEADPASLEEIDKNRLSYLQDMQEQKAKLNSFLAQFAGAEELIAFVESDTRDMWIAELRPGLEALRRYCDERGLDTPLADADWRAIKDELATADKTIWALGWGHSKAGDGLPTTVRQAKLSAIELVERDLTMVCADVAKLYYIDPARRALIPPDKLPSLEAHYRSLDDNRPQRLGGFHDGVQSQVDERPADKLLLLQMSCDYVFEMIWGDCGAIYSFISPEDLDACKFDKAETHLECG